jgi:hypothetical protein
VVPHPQANGNFNILGDLSDPWGGLIEMPKNIDGYRSPGYWDADWNTTTKKFENIVFNPTGEGVYNIFPIELDLERFVNHFSFNGAGTQELDSEDSKQLGHGMKIIIQYFTNEDNTNDHKWSFAANFTLHRKKTV